MIITRIKASNFYGIKDPIEVTFTEGGLAEKIGYVNIGKERVSLISGFYGANASGKSTVLNIIDTITRIMISKQQDFSLGANGIQQEVVISLPNFHTDMQLKPIILEMDFIIDKNKYNYSISIINEGNEIGEEILYKNSKKVFNRKNHNVIFEASIEKAIKAIAKNVTAPKKSSFLSVVLDDSSNVSVFGNIKEVMGISELKEIKTRFCFITDKRTVQSGQNNVIGLMAFAITCLNSKPEVAARLISVVNAVVRYFEPSLREIIIKPINQNSFDFAAYYNNFYKPLAVFELSAGTREIISYINDILGILRTGGVVVYDETSKYYHPDMEIAILNLFRDKDLNRNNAQIFFSSHNHETFDLLFNDQAHILEKNGNVISVNKVSEYDVAERVNVKKSYRLGSLGGIPDTIDFNRIINNLL